ncbi:MAG: MFS transporter [Chloroflexi bacterium]|nr:MFS transporter [Chloroflexota bacterium]
MNISMPVPPEAGKRPKIFYGYIVVASAFSLLAVLCAALYSFGVFLKPIAAEFSWTRALTSGAQSTNTFVSGVFCMITGRLTDKFGPRLVVTFCGILFGLGFLLMSRVNTAWQLYLFWGIMAGGGMSGGFVPLTSTITRWFTKRRGLMTGIVVAGVGVGTMIGPAAVARLMESYGWRTSLIMAGIMSLVFVVVAAQFLSRDPTKKGQTLYGGQAELKVPEIETWGLSLNEAVHTRQFWMLCMIYALIGVNQFVIMIHVVPHATDMGMSPIAAAGILSIIGGVSVAGRILLGSIADRVGNRQALLIGLSLMTAALFWLQVAREPWMLYLFAAIFGFGYGGEVAMISPVVAELFGMKTLGAKLGVVNFNYHLGLTTGPLLGGRIFDVTGSYYSAFLLAGMLGVIGIIMVTVLRPIRKETQAA